MYGGWKKADFHEEELHEAGQCRSERDEIEHGGNRRRCAVIVAILTKDIALEQYLTCLLAWNTIDAVPLFRFARSSPIRKTSSLQS